MTISLKRLKSFFVRGLRSGDLKGKTSGLIQDCSAEASDWPLFKAWGRSCCWCCCSCWCCCWCCCCCWCFVLSLQFNSRQLDSRQAAEEFCPLQHRPKIFCILMFFQRKKWIYALVTSFRWWYERNNLLQICSRFLPSWTFAEDFILDFLNTFVTYV